MFCAETLQYFSENLRKLGVGISGLELWSGHLDPLKASDDELKAWHKRFLDAGIKVTAYNVSPEDDWTDDQIDRGFQAAKLLGTNVITSSVTKKIVPRLDKACQKHKMKLGLHNHWFVPRDPNQFETPEDFLDTLKSSSKWININLDVGHFYAAGFDPLKFFEENHARVVGLHLKDRGSDPKHVDHAFREGATPIVPVMQAAKRLKFKYAAVIEWEVEGSDPVKGCAEALAYLKKALA